MGKRRQRWRRVRDHLPSGNSATKEEIRPQKERGWRLWILGSVGVILIAGFWIYQRRATLTALDLLPDPDLSSMEVRVVEKIRGLRGQVQKRPDSATNWGKLAMNLDVHGLKNESVSCYQQAAKLDGSEFRWPFFCAIVMHEIGSPAALEWFEHCRTMRPDDVALLVLQGQALFDAGQMEISARTFRRAIQMDPKSSHSYLGLARIALGRGDVQSSQRYLVQAVEINPGHGEAHGLLAGVYRRLERPKDAERELSLAKRLPRVTPVPSPLYVELVAEGVSSVWYRKRGRAYMAEGLYERAADEFKMALGASPDAQVHNNLGVALQHLKQYDGAVTHYRAAIALNPTYVQAWKNLGSTFMETGQVGETMRVASRLSWLLATSPQSAVRDGVEAVRLAEKLCRETGCQAAEQLDVLAAAYAEAGDFGRAIQAAGQAHRRALSVSQPNLAAEIRSRMKLYQAKRPYRESPGADHQIP